MRSIVWALYGVKFIALQEIEAIVGVGGYLILGPFSRDYGITILHNSVCIHMYWLQ